MELSEAKNLLSDYNKWRRGEEIPQPNPTQIGIAIDVVLAELDRPKEMNDIQIETWLDEETPFYGTIKNVSICRLFQKELLNRKP